MIIRGNKYLLCWFLVISAAVSFAEVTVSGITLTPYTNQVLAQWKDVRGAQKYEIQYSEYKDFSKASLKETNLVRQEIERLKSTTSYYFKIRVLNKNIWSGWSETRTCKTASYSVTVGTYNILSAKYDNVFPNNLWESRKNEMRNTILQSNNSPDIFGIQEGMVDKQVNELADLLKTTYVSHISKREISARAIFWKPEKFSLVAFDDNIEVLDSTIKGFSSQRFISYVCLKEKVTGNNLLVFNIHAPASYLADRSTVRNAFAVFIAEKAKALSRLKNNAPVVLLGDFNDVIHSTSSSKDILSAPTEVEQRGFEDTYTHATNRINANYATHDRITSGMASSANCREGIGVKRIDYLFVYPANKYVVSDFRIIINFKTESGSSLRQPIPSDHRPIRSTLHVYN